MTSTTVPAPPTPRAGRAARAVGVALGMLLAAVILAGCANAPVDGSPQAGPAG